MKKLFTLMLAVLMLCVSVMACAEMSKEEIQTLFESEMHEARYITQRGKAYEYESFQRYLSFWFQKVWSVTDYKNIPITDVENAEEILTTLKSLREQVVQVVEDPESVAWYIWGENMPQAADADTYDYSTSYDEAGFRPFLVPYMLEDQSAVKGNIVIVAGGGFKQRCNDNEGDPVAVYWNGKGYNCFILQRRVEPSASIDSSLDLARAVRYLRAHAEEKGIAKPETIITMGFSGGGMTILNQLNTCYGDLTPDVVYSDYVPDEIDRINADYPVAVIMYGTLSGYDSENPNMPALFLFGGEIDNKVSPLYVVDLYTTAINKGWPVEMYIAGETHHGIGVAGVRAYSNVGYTNALGYLGILDTYLDTKLGYKPATFTPCECVPVCDPATCTCEGCVTAGF